MESVIGGRMQKQRLELDWVGKDNEIFLEPRILLQEKVVGTLESQPNQLISGDNLLALKALEQDCAGKIKCVYIDPPYNTGSAFKHYDDGVEHSLWLSLMKPRLELMKRLISNDGTIWISIDDTEGHYLKVLCDEIFGRANFVTTVVWQKKYAPANDAKWLSDDHDFILVYAKNKESWRPNKLARTDKQNSLYKNPDGDTRGPWMSDNYTCNKSSEERPNLYYSVLNPNTGEEIWPKKTAVWRYSKERHEDNIKKSLVYWGKQGKNSVPRFKKFLTTVADKGIVPSTIWLHEDIGHTQDAKREAMVLNPDDPFPTPKPESLIRRILSLATNKGDWVLDSFLGSGTTAAVAHKMGRRWIGIESGEHCYSHCLPRLESVISGKDQGGISVETQWNGGGGFEMCRLAPSLLLKDSRGNWIISPAYNALQLAQAVCKHEGFKFWPDQQFYWKQGQSTEKDFIFVTTEFLTAERLDKIAAQLKPDESLLICAKAFKVAKTKHQNITIKKIHDNLSTRPNYSQY